MVKYDNWCNDRSLCDKSTKIGTNDEISNVITFLDFQSDFFIGLRRLSNGGDFHWQIDNARLSYADWDYMQPDNFRGNNLCVRINNNYKWEDSHCYIKNYYLCQAKL